MRVGLYNLFDMIKARASGNKGRFVVLDWGSFFKGYNLIAQFGGHEEHWPVYAFGYPTKPRAAVSYGFPKVSEKLERFRDLLLPGLRSAENKFGNGVVETDLEIANGAVGIHCYNLKTKKGIRASAGFLYEDSIASGEYKTKFYPLAVEMVKTTAEMT